MSDIPIDMLEVRQELSRKYLKGSGIEIGALHQPLWIEKNVNIRYIDRLSKKELLSQYPELQNYNLVDVEVIDDGEKLTKISDNQLDFIIGNHFIEHCQNPLGTIRNHLSKLRNGGLLYYAVPDKNFCFDRERPLTTIEHLLKDDREGSEVSKYEHFLEWAQLVNKVPNQELQNHIKKLMEIDYSIHFHVWDENTFRDFLISARSYLKNAFNQILVERNGTEIIAILQKNSH